MINVSPQIDLPRFPELYVFAGYPYKDEKTVLINVDGYKWCVFGDNRLDDVVNDSFSLSKLSVFGFPLSEEM